MAQFYNDPSQIQTTHDQLNLPRITVCKNPNQEVLSRARSLQDKYGLEIVNRDVEGPLLVVTRTGLASRSINDQQHQLMRWHPGLLHALRESGFDHPWVKLGELKCGDRVLDCTLGLGTDARFISEITKHQVIGLERSLAVFLLAEEGLASVDAKVTPIWCDCREYLETLIDHSDPLKSEIKFDVLIVDPMFPRHLTTDRHGLDFVRIYGDHRPISAHDLKLARQVASRWVVVKDHRKGQLLERLGDDVEPAETIWSRGKRSTRYGRWCGLA